MALNLQQLDALTTSEQFISRVRSAVRKRANFVRNQGQTPSGAEQAWAYRILNTVGQADLCARLSMPTLVNDPNVSGSSAGDGSDITDTVLQSAVEAICELFG